MILDGAGLSVREASKLISCDDELLLMTAQACGAKTACYASKCGVYVVLVKHGA